MKFINKSEPQFKTVKYFDLEFQVPIHVDHIAVNENGSVVPFYGEPFIDSMFDVWNGSICSHVIGIVDLEGMDWKQTLQRV